MRSGFWDWKFWTTLAVSLISVAVTFYIWRVDQKSKSISIEVVSSTNLTPIKNNNFEGLELKFNGKNIDNLFLQVIEIENTGSKPIPASDYEGLISISFGHGAEILSVNPDKFVPSDLHPVIAFDDKAFEIKPLLLNSGDLMRFSFLTGNAKPVLQTRARIAGAQLELKDSVHKESFLINKIFVFIVAGFLFFMYFHNIFKVTSDWKKYREIRIITLLFALVSIAAANVVQSLFSHLHGDPLSFMDFAITMFPPSLLALFLLIRGFYDSEKLTSN